MPWRNTSMVSQRRHFIERYQSGFESVTDLCREFEISRTTAYKWIERHAESGPAGLLDRSRTPHNNPRRVVDDTVTDLIIHAKKTHVHWGPRKLKTWIENHYDEKMPSKSTVGRILEEHGLVSPRRIRSRVPATAPLQPCNSPNDVWLYDFKGWFLTGDNRKCEPLTITDGHSRFLLECKCLQKKSTQGVWEIFQQLFRTYGLPYRVRSDNGPPFASRGPGRLSRLAILLIKAGVQPEWITPGKPQENGRHERFHQTLKKETANPPAHTIIEQEKRFLDFQLIYNHERPHEALDLKVPSAVYIPSERDWDGKLRSPEYDEGYTKRVVRPCGRIGWRGDDLFISECLEGEHVCLKETSEDIFEVYYGPISLGYIGKGRFKKHKRIE